MAERIPRPTAGWRAAARGSGPEGRRRAVRGHASPLARPHGRHVRAL